jgi:hypothetical protein
MDVVISFSAVTRDQGFQMGWTWLDDLTDDVLLGKHF